MEILTKKSVLIYFINLCRRMTATFFIFSPSDLVFIKSIMKRICYALILFWQTSACQTSAPAQYIALDARHTLALLDSAKAARAISTDKTDQFFERVTPAEMSIQMKRPLGKKVKRDRMLADYRAFLSRDVANFTTDEAEFVRSVWAEVFQQCKGMADNLFPDTLFLIKTPGKHYGDGVYYTRERCIVIPANTLKERNRESFTSTMYHELFHVYSRMQPAKRAALYKTIGFEAIGYNKLQLPPDLAARVLHNPDGVDFAQKITLSTPKGTIFAAPIIYANAPGYTAKQPSFFGYLGFSLFQIEPRRDGTWEAIVKPDGFSPTLDMRNLPDFYRQIRDNTGYIIHPDEVLADNFAFLLRGKTNPAVTAGFSAPGKSLLAEMEQILIK